jgi:hypothetical protein
MPDNARELAGSLLLKIKVQGMFVDLAVSGSCRRTSL